MMPFFLHVSLCFYLYCLLLFCYSPNFPPFLFFLFKSSLMGQIRVKKLDPEVIGHKYNKLRDWHHDVSARLLNV